GDGGPATAAQLQGPAGIVSDPAGNIFFSDGTTIRRIDGQTGILTTIAGNGASGQTGDYGPAVSAELSGPRALAFDPAGNLYFCDGVRIRRIDAATGAITTVAGTNQGFTSGDG